MIDNSEGQLLCQFIERHHYLGYRVPFGANPRYFVESRDGRILAFGTIYMPSNDYQIILEAQPQFRVDPSDLSKLYVKTTNNQTIPLDAVAKLVPSVGPLQINHQAQQPAKLIFLRPLHRNYRLVSCGTRSTR